MHDHDPRQRRPAASSAGRGGALARVSLVLIAMSLVAGCATKPVTTSRRSKEYFSEKEYGVKASPRIVNYGEPVPRGGGRQMVGVPYMVRGKWYFPGQTAFVQTGLASWYGMAFHGRQTANGEVYDVDGLSAAHPTLPLPSYARVTNLDSGRSVVVRVNDRGPYFSNRIMDLSARAAQLLEYKENGVGRVKMEYMGPARMDGQDQRMLMASYRGPGSVMLARNILPAWKGPTTSVAFAAPSKAGQDRIGMFAANGPAAAPSPPGHGAISAGQTSPPTDRMNAVPRDPPPASAGRPVPPPPRSNDPLALLIQARI